MYRFGIWSKLVTIAEIVFVISMFKCVKHFCRVKLDVKETLNRKKDVLASKKKCRWYNLCLPSTSSDPWLCQDLNICVIFFPPNLTQLSITSLYPWLFTYLLNSVISIVYCTDSQHNKPYKRKGHLRMDERWSFPVIWASNKVLLC